MYRQKDYIHVLNSIQCAIVFFRFGGLDAVVYNAGAILHEKVVNTPLKRYDLMHNVNIRGAYCMVQQILPHFLQKKSGKIILVSPPIYNRYKILLIFVQFCIGSFARYRLGLCEVMSSLSICHCLMSSCCH